VWVGNVTAYTAKGMSKDNYFFGVRAVDKDGNRSPVSYPHPATQAPRPAPRAQD
jgi:beta-N-acetylglucosaminidase